MGEGEAMSHDALSDQQFPGYKHTGARMVPLHEIRTWKSGDFPDAGSLAGLSALSDTTRSSWYTPDEAKRFNDTVAAEGRITTPLRASYSHAEGRNELWDGHHRYWAARTAGITHLPVEWDTEYGHDDPRYAR